MSFGITAGVYVYEIDKSAFVTSTATSIGACVAGLLKGPIGPHFVSSIDEFYTLYGYTPASWSKAPNCIKAALRQTSMFYVNRVVNGALYSGLSFVKSGNNYTSAPFVTGSENDYTSSSREINLLTLSSYLIEGEKISIDLQDGNLDIVTVSQDFTTTSNETLYQFATKLNAKLSEFGEGGSAQAIKVWKSAPRCQQITLTFDNELTASSFGKIEGNIVLLDGTTKKPFSCEFTQSNDYTLQLLANNINDIAGFNSAVVPGLSGENSARSILINSDNAGPDSFSLEYTITSGTVPTETVTASDKISKEGHGEYDDRTIQVILPNNTELSLVNPSYEGKRQVELKVEKDIKAFDVFAENPGEWANDYGIKISNIDEGTASRFKITISSALVANNVISTDITWDNETVNISQEFEKTSDYTLKQFASKIKTVLSALGNSGDAFVNEVRGGYDNDREIVIVSPTPMDDVVIENTIVTNGLTQAICSSTKTLDAIEPSGIFTLGVYIASDVENPVEQFTVSSKKLIDANGNQLYIEDVINNSSSGSNIIRIKITNADLLDDLVASQSIMYMNGGDDGALPTNNQIIKGWDEFADPEKVTVRVLINGGYTAIGVQQAMDSLAQNRKDCFAILDCPSDKQSATDYVYYRKYELNINSSYSAIYGPDLLITDDDTGEQMYIPPSGHIAAQYFYTDTNAETWYAPAGLNRGVVQKVEGLRETYGKGERPLLDQAQCNYVRDMAGYGFAIWGEHTLQSKTSALSDVHVRRLLITLETSIADYLNYAVFDPNDQYQRDALVGSIKEYLKNLSSSRAFQTDNDEGYYVISDSTNNPDYIIDQGIMVVDVAIKPIRVAKFIKLNVTIAKTSAEFSELLAS